jgi:hypothetical protein
MPRQVPTHGCHIGPRRVEVARGVPMVAGVCMTMANAMVIVSLAHNDT